MQHCNTFAKRIYIAPRLKLLILTHECMLHEISTHIGTTPATEEDEGGRARPFELGEEIEGY